MVRSWFVCLLIYVVLEAVVGVSTKLDFGDDESPATGTNGNEDEDVEVKQTIVVSTKVKNNNNSNRRAITSLSNGNSGTLTYKVGSNKNSKKDGEEVPIVPGYKAVETTHLRTPDTRHNHKMYPESPIINRNIRDELDVFPNIGFNPQQWKPASFFNNINWNYQNNFDPYKSRTYRPAYQNPGIHRKVSDAGVQDFYCRKCAELSVNVFNTNTPSLKGCIQVRNNPWVDTTTVKIKLDGKLAKLN